MKYPAFTYILVMLCMSSMSQLSTVRNNKLVFPVVVKTESGTVRGYLWHVSDSAVLLSSYKELTAAGEPQQPFYFLADNIKSFTIKKRKFNPLVPVVGALVGFILGAGLASNDDADGDGQTSFLELIFSAISGNTSDNRARRRVALRIGCVTGVIGFTAGFFQGDKVVVRLPLFARKKNFQAQRIRVESFLYNN